MSTLKKILTQLTALNVEECLEACHEFQRGYADDYVQVLEHLRSDPAATAQIAGLCKVVEKYLHTVCRRFEIRSARVQKLLEAHEILEKYRDVRQQIFPDDARDQVGEDIYAAIVQCSALHAACVARVMLVIPDLERLRESEDASDDDAGDGRDHTGSRRTMHETASAAQLVETDLDVDLGSKDAAGPAS